ncbi:hypothetical protein CVIRNUC_005353 [Coccomyxa viridis]|uniref:Uncharacterized protein n=1 Tax=Coccomyxa viridis TaxID=1274662 RepID=A0AAV1I775_9CHLO|nr:hypothetical protein CVIRNUC_005353 [Coccomyxa viridis]
MASSPQQWNSEWGDANAHNSHPQTATYGKKSYEPFRLTNIWKRGKQTAKDLYRQGKYRSKEVGEQLEQWRKRA